MRPPFIPRLLVFDLDGTLVPEGADHVAADVVNALDRWRAAGVPLVILTARDRISPTIMQQVQPSFTGVMNGALIRQGERVIAETGLSSEDLRVTLTHSLQEAQVMISTPEGFLAVLSEAQQASPHVQHWLAAHGVRPYIPDPAVTALKVRFVHQDVAAHARTLRPIPSLTVTGAVPPYPDSLVVTAAGANKAAALRRIAREVRLSLRDVMAFGDSDNDQTMLADAGYGVRIGDHPQLIPVSQARLPCLEQLGGYLTQLLAGSQLSAPEGLRLT